MSDKTMTVSDTARPQPQPTPVTSVARLTATYAGGRHCRPPQTCSSSTDQGRRRRRRRTCLEALPPSSSEPVTMPPREPLPPYPEPPLRRIPSPPPRRPRFEFRILSFGCGFRSTIPFLLKIFGSRVLVAGWCCWC